MGREDPLPGDRVRVSPNPRRISRIFRLRPRFVMLKSPVMVRQSRFSPQISSKNPDSRSSLILVGTDHLTTGAGGELLIDAQLRRAVRPAVLQVGARLDGGGRLGNVHEG